MHKRNEIRDAVIALLLGSTVAGTTVFQSRTRRVQENELPCISVFTSTETIEDRDEAPRYYRRTLTVVVECYLKATDNLDQALDAFSYQVEVALQSVDRLGLDFVQDFRPKNSVPSLVGERAEHLAGCMQIEFECIYDTPAGPSPEDLDNLNTVTAYWQLDQDVESEADDTIDLEDTHI